MNRRWLFSIGLGILLLSGCGTPDAGTTPEADSSNTETVEPETDSPSPSDDTLDDESDASDAATRISADGIGLAQLGMTYGDLKQALGDGTEYTVESPFIVDFDAIAVRQNDEVQFYILYLASETFSDTDVIQGLMTTNPDYQTEAGVGVGTSIQVAEAAYGDATLSYNLANESREYVRFENQPSKNISFGTYGGGSAATERVGLYSSPAAEYNETQDYVEGATIQTVLVICLAETCT